MASADLLLHPVRLRIVQALLGLWVALEPFRAAAGR